MVMSLHPKYFYKTFAPFFRKKKKRNISFKNTLSKDHQHVETQPKVPRKKIHQRRSILAEKFIKNEYIKSS